MPRKKDGKVIRYHRSLQFDIGLVVFVIFFIYIVYNVGSYLTKENPSIYEVGQVTTAVKDNTYDGLILRKESVYTTDRAGYINYYVRENARASVGETVYSIDENGSYTQLLNSSATGSSSLTADQLSALKKKLAAFSASYDPSSFSQIYEAKYGVENLLMSYLSAESLEQLDELGIDTTYLTTVDAEESGIIEYMNDGMETLTEDELTAASFNRSNYEVNTVNAGTMLEKGAFAYKVLTSEEWYVYLQLTEDDQQDLQDAEKVYLHFNDVNIDVAAEFSMITTSDNIVLGRCKLSRYMIQLADRRFASVTLKKSEMSSLTVSGLKIPKTAVVTKEFYVIPEAYAAKGSNSNDIGFIRELYTADGTQAVMIYPSIYAHFDGYYYIDMDDIEGGTVLRMPANPLIEQKTDEEAALAVSDEDPENDEEDETMTEANSDEDGESMDTEGAEGEDPDAEDSSLEETISAYNPDMEMDGGVYEPVETTEAAVEEGEASSESANSLGGEVVESEETYEYVSESTVGDSYTIGETQPLKGALSVNKGYALFKQITILAETDDYYIVQTGQSYGLAVYDHILLNGETAEEGDLIY